MNYKVDDIVQMKFGCKCGCAKNEWVIIRTGADVKIKCLSCKENILLPLGEFETKVRSLTDDKQTKNSKCDIDLDLYEIGDLINLNCKCVGFHRKQYLFLDNKYPYVGELIKKSGSTLGLKCINCGKKYFEDIEKLKALSIENLSLNDRLKEQEKFKEQKEIEGMAKEIEEDKQFQIKTFGKLIDNNTLIATTNDCKCPTCNKRIFKAKLPINLNKPVELTCESCLDVSSHKFKMTDFKEIDLTPEYTKDGLPIVKVIPNRIKVACLNCGNDAIAQRYRKTINSSRKDKVNVFSYYRIDCPACKGTKPLYYSRNDFYKLIYSLDESVIFSLDYQNFIPYDSNIVRVKLDYKTFNTLSDIPYDDTILKLQLIDSPNNHVSKKHTIKNVKVHVPYRKDKLLSVIEFKCHYCRDCKEYFDFNNSFISQLKNNYLSINDLCIQIKKNDEQYMSLFKTDEFDGFAEESLLHAYGYKVGYSGLATASRQKLLGKIIDNKILSISQIKNTLNNNIKLFEGRYGYELAVQEWKEDLGYINSKIK